ncbi:protein UXT [Sabethes cyaneus]|uniref:protein UXT n=1 Tax=Sabethes cyaneus TaxID=53552 RepID=UPI00237ED3C5|nr:protein UXT [Sabethes cyaneus]
MAPAINERLAPSNIESFVNDCLREDLKVYEQQLIRLNNEIMEYIQLKNVIENLPDTGETLKTQVNIGANFFMKAKAERVEKLLVDVGLRCYMEFSPEEALRFVDMKVKILTKQANTIRDKSVEIKANIKLALLVIGDTNKLH